MNLVANSGRHYIEKVNDDVTFEMKESVSTAVGLDRRDSFTLLKSARPD